MSRTIRALTAATAVSLVVALVVGHPPTDRATAATQLVYRNHARPFPGEFVVFKLHARGRRPHGVVVRDQRTGQFTRRWVSPRNPIARARLSIDVRLRARLTRRRLRVRVFNGTSSRRTIKVRVRVVKR